MGIALACCAADALCCATSSAIVRSPDKRHPGLIQVEMLLLCNALESIHSHSLHVHYRIRTDDGARMGLGVCGFLCTIGTDIVLLSLLFMHSYELVYPPTQSLGISHPKYTVPTHMRCELLELLGCR